MAIEVIERGELPTERVYEATCYNCKSTLRFKRGDAEYVSDQRDGDSLKVTCPVCNCSVYRTLTK